MTNTLLVALALLAAPLGAEPAGPAPGREGSAPAGVQTAANHANVRALALSAPTTVLELEVGKLEGEPIRLSWSDDGRLIYVRTVQVDFWGNESWRHFVIDLASPGLKTVEGEPLWAAVYWVAKSALDAPGIPDFRVELETREERVTAAGVQGALAPQSDPTRGSELGPQGAAIASSVLQAQKVVRSTLKLNGEPIGEFVNTPPRMGLTFGWGPAGSGLIAFVDAKARLGLMGRTGDSRVVAGGRNVRLPAWSPDGRTLAFLERAGKKRYELRTVAVSVREP